MVIDDDDDDDDDVVTKKKLEETDDVKDVVTPVTEFRQDALADANMRGLKWGDIIEFVRGGYYIFDGVVNRLAHMTWPFIPIPDRRATSPREQSDGHRGQGG
jgi:glutamyl-tRNA synthetase